jgi:hypothetical protein
MEWLRRGVAAVLSVLALVGAVRLVAPATGTSGVQRQLAFLRDALADGAGEDAQQLYPEGYFFLHVLYGLTWVELGMRSGGHGTALREARWAWAPSCGGAAIPLLPVVGILWPGEKR